ncbi:sphingomyelin synthase-related protein 1 isoform X4 [Cervus elaphus]|uniref:sphingomyelin synthase-related protein 1 isoform X4 n=1 Tax=Cervus elaphus TaxID=9860 RepID=UPI001CC31017|nr:sphingomyelin synthase-related protein 1 isoform X4 [Cervus elaphus]
MPARSRHRPSLHSGSLTRAPPPPLKASLSREARRAPDSDSCSDADSEAGPGSPIRNKETEAVVSLWGLWKNQDCPE